MQRIQNRELLDQYHSKACLACGKKPSDPCHIRSRGAGGPDEKFNLMPLCREHHTEQHKIGWDSMRRKYFKVHLAFWELGWTKLNGRLWHDKLGVGNDAPEV